MMLKYNVFKFFRFFFLFQKIKVNIVIGAVHARKICSLQ